MADWSRVVNTTIAKYIRGEEVAIMRNRKVLALLQKRGRVSFNHGGTNLDWKVRYKRAPLSGYAENDTLTFTRRDRWKTATLDWRAYVATDAMDKFEKEKNKGTEAIIKVYTQIAQSLRDDIDDQFGDEIYNDGNASSTGIHGIESFMGNGGASANGYIGTPSDTYAGLSTALGNYGGTWDSAVWPRGNGQAHYDFWSPLIVDYTDSLWTAATDTWADNATDVLTFGIIHAQKNKGKDGMLDLILADRELYRQFVDLLRTREQLQVNPGSHSELVQMGFTDVVNHDGVDVSWEYGVPANVAYGWNISSTELCSMQSSLFVPEGPVYDEATRTHRFTIDFMGNLKFKQTRHFVKWMSIS